MRCHRYSAPIVYLTTVEFRWTSNSNEVRKAADYAMEMAEQLKVARDLTLCTKTRPASSRNLWPGNSHPLVACRLPWTCSFVDGLTVQYINLNVCRFVSTCTCVHTRLNKIHGFGQNISFLSCAFSLYST